MSKRELVELFLSINLKDYENLKLDFKINIFLIALFIGALIAIIISSIYRSTVYLTANRLLRKEAVGEESAMTLSELGINLWRVRYVLSGNSRLRDIISIKGELKPTYEEYIEQMKAKKTDSDKPNFDEAKFYIQPDKVDKAKEILLKSNTSTLNIVLSCVLLFIVTVTLIILMPEILSWLNGVLAPKA